MKISRTLLNVGGTVAFGLSLSFSVSAMDEQTQHRAFVQDIQGTADQYNAYCTQEEVPVEERVDLTRVHTFEVLEDSVQTHVWVYDTVTKTRIQLTLDQVREGDDRYQLCETHNVCEKKPANPSCEQNQGK